MELENENIEVSKKAEIQKKLKMKKIWKNFYVFSALIFATWMLFFDNNNYFQMNEHKAKLKDLQEQKAYYSQSIKDYKREYKELSSDPKSLEKFAREKKFFKKKNEDIYIVEE